MPIIEKNKYIKEVKKPYYTPIKSNIQLQIASATDTIIPLTSTPPYNEYFLNPQGYTGEKSITLTDPNGDIIDVPLSGGEFAPTISGIYAIIYKGAIRRYEGTSAFQDSPFTFAFT